MKSTAINKSNSIIEKIKRDLSNIYGMLTSSDEISEDEFPRTTNFEAEVEILKKSRSKLDATAKQYEDSIGVPSRSKKQAQTNTKKQVQVKANQYQSPILSTSLKNEDSTKNVERNKNEDLTK